MNMVIGVNARAFYKERGRVKEEGEGAMKCCYNFKALITDIRKQIHKHANTHTKKQ